MKPLVLFLALLLVFPTALADKSKSKTKPIDMKLSGLLIHVDEGGLFTVELKGKPGAATGRGLAVTGPPVIHENLPVGHACRNLDSVLGVSGAIITEAQMAMTFKDGSMIWGDAAPDGYVCYSGFAYAPYDILGGHKRFEGAEGWVVFEIDTQRLPDPSLVTVETGIATGEIILP